MSDESIHDDTASHQDEVVDMSDRETRVDPEVLDAADLGLSESELMDLSESDTEPPFKTNTTLIDITAGDSEPKGDGSELNEPTARLMRRNEGMVPIYDNDEEFPPIQSTQKVEKTDSLSDKKSWWQFWK